MNLTRKGIQGMLAKASAPPVTIPAGVLERPRDVNSSHDLTVDLHSMPSVNYTIRMLVVATIAPGGSFQMQVLQSDDPAMGGASTLYIFPDIVASGTYLLSHLVTPSSRYLQMFWVGHVFPTQAYAAATIEPT